MEKEVKEHFTDSMGTSFEVFTLECFGKILDRMYQIWQAIIANSECWTRFVKSHHCGLDNIIIIFTKTLIFKTSSHFQIHVLVATFSTCGFITISDFLDITKQKKENWAHLLQTPSIELSKKGLHFFQTLVKVFSLLKTLKQFEFYEPPLA